LQLIEIGCDFETDQLAIATVAVAPESAHAIQIQQPAQVEHQQGGGIRAIRHGLIPVMNSVVMPK